jgi:2-oxoglutarate dehydrogenase E2 component (dihydrolipoamide succinyltransferase)
VEEKAGRGRGAADEILIEIETDKVVLEVPAPSAGVLAEYPGRRWRHGGV